MTDTASSGTHREQRLLDLLPQHLRKRDEASGGTLRALLTAVADELTVLEEDLEDLLDGWFVETCAEWLIPYLADLVGIDEPLPDLGSGASWRTVVGRTVAYRRRKGTAAVLEQVARDVTGWPARAVEYFGLLAATAHVNHLRLDRPAVVSLRGRDRLDLTGSAHDLRADRSTPPPELVDLTRGALDPLPRTAEVRGIERGRGRHGIPRVGIFLFPWHTYEVGEARPTGSLEDAGWAQARPVDRGFSVDPLGRHSPLFAGSRHGTGIEHLAQEEDLPLPLRPRRLLALLEAARSDALQPEDLPVAVRIGRTAQTLPPDRLSVCGLENPPTLAGDRVSIDTLTGHLHVHHDNAPAGPETQVFVRYAHGGVADVGAGVYDRSEVLERVLASDAFDEREGVIGQVSVRSGAETGPHVVPSVSEALARAEATLSRGPGGAGRSAAGATFVVSIGDSARYEGELNLDVPERTRLLLVAAAWPRRQVPGGDPARPNVGTYVPDGLRPHVRGSLRVKGARGSSVVLDGLVLDGDLRVEPGQAGSITLSQCTVGGRLSVAGGDAPDVTNGDLRVNVVRSLVGGVELAPSVPVLAISDSALGPLPGHDGLTLSGEGAHLSLRGVTVRGGATVRSMDGESSVLDGPVRVEHRQTGCLRFCYARLDSRVPRRFRCVPGEGDRPDIAPVYASENPGSPLFLSLARTCPPVIVHGGEGGAEMGVHHHLGRPLRLSAAGKHLASYVPAGLEIGIFGS
ncbi:hypothetical protein ACFYNL_05895 [Streptomyces sp. NPDC007808]|uniref:hypothetical protein n=1 Tax=Streptomyces sp. NPDC007808 TaxID=3364779 RepID=UPI0036C4C74F